MTHGGTALIAGDVVMVIMQDFITATMQGTITIITPITTIALITTATVTKEVFTLLRVAAPPM